VELSLVEHVGRGEWLDLAADEVINEAAMRSWGASRTCRASVIRDILRGRLAVDPDPHGLRLQGALIVGRLDLENLTTDINLELKECFLEEGLLARNARLASVALAGSQLEHPAEPPLDAAWLTCSVLNLKDARIFGHAKAGAVCLVGANIGGQLDCTSAQLRNDSGPALDGDGLQVGQDLQAAVLTASGSGYLGAVRLVGAKIGGQLDFGAADLLNDSGPAESSSVESSSVESAPALIADGLQVGQGMFGPATATGSGHRGAVRLVGAHIGGSLECDGAALINDSGPALVADGLQVSQGMFLRYRFTATGSSHLGAVRLVDAHIGGQLDCTNSALRNDSGPALAASGLTYAGVPHGISGPEWRNLLRDGTRSYAAQPYQQLAAGYRAAGQERQAREILMAQRDDELTLTDTGWRERLWGRITKVTLGYGYQPWRALLFLAAVVAISCVLAVVLGWHGALVQSKQTATPGRPCTVIQKVSVGLDLNLPIGTSVGRADCDLTTDSASVTAAWLTAVGWVLRLLAWAFAALFIAGFTSAVRKT